MKGRPFLAGLLVVALLALGLGWGGWWWVWQRGPLQLQHHTLTIPRAARFVPRQAPLALYLFSDGERPVDYTRAVAPLRQRREAIKSVERLRDGAFAAAGLDYHDELASWLAPEMALSVLDAPEGEGGGSWLLALSSKDEEGARRFLQRFWQARSLAGSGLQISQYRGMGLISGRGALVGRDPVPLATALVQDDLVLIASGRATLERALDVSQIEALNEAGLAPLQEGVASLGEGMALVVARSGAFGPWLGLPALETNSGASAPLLVGALQPRGTQLVLNGLLHTPAEATEIPPDPLEPAPGPGEMPLPEPALLSGLGGRSDSLAILRHPGALQRIPWLGPLVRRITTPSAGGPLPPLLAAADPGVLLLSQSPEGWLAGTSGPIPHPDILEAGLAAEGLIEAPLEVAGEQVTVWTHLRAIGGSEGRNKGSGEGLRASVAGWRRQGEGVAWWGETLAQLQNRSPGRGLLARQRQLARLNRPDAPLRWVLGDEAASKLLQHWRPWTLMTTLAGGGLADGPRDLAFALDAPEHGTTRWTARIDFAPGSHG
jgi:hypothetical protein